MEAEEPGAKRGSDRPWGDSAAPQAKRAATPVITEALGCEPDLKPDSDPFEGGWMSFE